MPATATPPPAPSPASERRLPEVWAHRGASLEFPENSLASFEAAVLEGSEGLETDIHTTLDNIILMFHDPTLERTTDGHGQIKDQNWAGVIEHARTLKKPHQAIPLFTDLLALLMRPDARHVRINIDVKPNNDPERCFAIMGERLREVPNWEKDLAPRLILGLWHPSFLEPAKRLIPGATIHHITPSLSLSQSHFFPHVDGFSVAFPLLLTPAGAAFRERCEREGKEWGVWTVNDPAEMCVAAEWGAHWILTDTPAVWKNLRAQLALDFEGTYSAHVRPWFTWSAIRYYTPYHLYWDRLVRAKLTGIAGPLDVPPPPPSPPSAINNGVVVELNEKDTASHSDTLATDLVASPAPTSPPRANSGLRGVA